jgi:hypothetical protein
MIAIERAERLRAAGLRWTPRSGDRFVIDRPALAGEVFTISEMTIEAHDYPTGTVLGFNGTTEWALDSVTQDDAVWLPREDQLRDLLGGTFRSLARALDGTSRWSPSCPAARSAASWRRMRPTPTPTRCSRWSRPPGSERAAGARTGGPCPTAPVPQHRRRSRHV